MISLKSSVIWMNARRATRRWGEDIRMQQREFIKLIGGTAASVPLGIEVPANLLARADEVME